MNPTNNQRPTERNSHNRGMAMKKESQGSIPKQPADPTSTQKDNGNTVNNFVEQYTRLATEEQRENFLVGYNNDNEEPFNDDEVDILLRDLHSTSEPFFKVAIINCLARNSNSFFVKNALIALISDMSEDELVLSHAAQDLRWYRLDADDYQVVFDALVEYHGKERYENCTSSLIRILYRNRKKGALPYLLELRSRGFYQGV